MPGNSLKYGKIHIRKAFLRKMDYTEIYYRTGLGPARIEPEPFHH